MTTELEQALTEALTARAARITPDRLRYQGLRGQAAPQRRWSRRVASRWTVLVAVAGVLAVVAGVGAVARGLLGDRFEVTPAAQAFVGAPWRLESVVHDGRTTTTPASLRTTLTLQRDGTYEINDSVNHHAGRYSLTATGFLTRDGMSTAAAYAGDDPDVLATIEALGSITTGRPSSEGVFGAPAPVTAQVLGGRLVLETWGYQLTFHRDASPRQP